MTITVVVGPPAGGKSTYVANTRKPADVVVDFDLLATALGSTNTHDAPEDIRSVTHAARGAAIARINRGINTNAWIISTNPTPAEITTWAEAGAKFITVDPGQTETLKRATSTRPAERIDIINQWYDNPPKLPTGTTATGSTGTASAALRALAASRKPSSNA